MSRPRFIEELSPDSLSKQLHDAGVTLGQPLHVAESTGSTNEDAVKAADHGAAHGSTFVAGEQTSGRGRLGRSWESPAHENLYFSCVLRPSLPVDMVPTLSIAMGLAVRDALAGLLPPSVFVGLKWPNDVLVDGKKVSGILAEAAMLDMRCDYVVVGVGVNVAQREYSMALRDRATSLALLGANVSRRDVLVACLTQMEKRLGELQQDGLLGMQGDIARWSVLRGKQVNISGVAGQVVGIDGRGRLQVRTADGHVRAFGSGEASLHEP